ncbi:MAG: hypothetical protein J1E02_01620 [Coprobacter sp.]|nr:hypothetical protein [Coprobacter sp.]
MREEKDIRDDEIRVIGGSDRPRPTKRYQWLPAAFVAIVAIISIIAWRVVHSKQQPTETEQPESAYFEPQDSLSASMHAVHRHRIGHDVDSLARGFCEIRDTTINDIPLQLFIPHNAEMMLHVGQVNQRDTSIIYVAQAADIRQDNGKIVGAFVLNGEPLAWGLSKKGFCSVIDGKVTIGVAENSQLFEKATERGGYFFRQYPLVKDGVLVENEPKNKSVRRAICDRQGEIFMVESLTKESFHDFAQALVDLGVDQAVYLVGSSAYGWAVDKSGERHEFGENNGYTGRHKMPANTNYIVWKRYE